MAVKNLTIRIDDAMLDKLHVIADYEGRSANSQVLILIRDCIKRYEQEHGEIQTTRQTPMRTAPPSRVARTRQRRPSQKTAPAKLPGAQRTPVAPRARASVDR